VNATRGEHLVQELLWVHGILRSDLETVSRLADEVLDGRQPEDVRADIARLKTQSPLWQLKVNCLYYCRFVHAHHNGEDAHVFPALRRSNPALETVVDKLEADHRKVSDILDEVEQSSDDLVREDTPVRRQHVVSTLNLLTEHLLTHLDYEEEAISPTLRTWDRWPFF
jgi:iron-sulfur cluster repair protein YtfE (RIC family)